MLTLLCLELCSMFLVYFGRDKDILLIICAGNLEKSLTSSFYYNQMACNERSSSPDYDIIISNHILTMFSLELDLQHVFFSKTFHECRNRLLKNGNVVKEFHKSKNMERQRFLFVVRLNLQQFRPFIPNFFFKSGRKFYFLIGTMVSSIK